MVVEKAHPLVTGNNVGQLRDNVAVTGYDTGPSGKLVTAGAGCDRDS